MWREIKAYMAEVPDLIGLLIIWGVLYIALRIFG